MGDSKWQSTLQLLVPVTLALKQFTIISEYTEINWIPPRLGIFWTSWRTFNSTIYITIRSKSPQKSPRRAKRCQIHLLSLSQLWTFSDKNWGYLQPNRLYNFIIQGLRKVYTKRQDNWTIGGQTTANLPHPCMIQTSLNKLGNTPRKGPMAGVQAHKAIIICVKVDTNPVLVSKIHEISLNLIKSSICSLQNSHFEQWRPYWLLVRCQIVRNVMSHNIIAEDIE